VGIVNLENKVLLNCFINKLKLRPLVVAVAGALAVSSLLSCSGDKQANQANVLAASQLSQQVLNPPQDAKPRVWWHWMNGNVTKEGIAADLAWMNKVGIGGVQNFDAQLMTPHIVDKPVSYMTDEWQDLFRFALAEAQKYDFEYAIAASPGWSETGGPWVAPKDGMKKLVWTTQTVKGGSSNKIVLKAPPKTTGLFMDYGMPGEIFVAKEEGKHLPEYYEDVAVLAYPVNEPDVIQVVSVKASDNSVIKLKDLQDGSYLSSINMKSDPKSPSFLDFDLGKEQIVRSMSIALPPPGMFAPALLAPQLEVSTDGKTFTKIATFSKTDGLQSTVSFDGVRAKTLRLVFASNADGLFQLPSSSAPGAKPPMHMPGSVGDGKLDVTLLEVGIYAQAKVHRFEEKAVYALAEDYYPISYQLDSQGVPVDHVLNLSDKLQADGSLDWQPPAGNWQVIRLGYSLTGKENHPAPPEATGLEVDKYDADAVRRYINTYLDKYLAVVGKEQMGERGIKALLNDSIESGPSNWSTHLIEEFKQRRGYGITHWLPALTGVIIGDAQKTDAFLYDFRQTLAEMIADNHYAVISEEVRKRGMTHYSEALESGRPSMGDGMRMRRHADIPMAAMWSFDTANNTGPAPQYWSDIREAASVAHIYGQNIVAAESLTSALSPWAFAPKDLKPMIDMEFALGVNRPIIHTSVHQPLTDKAPGLSLFVFGQYFNRLDTWAEYAKPWVSYITRNAFMLQQGRFAADVAYFYGEEAPLTALYNDAPPTDVSNQNGFDYVNADVILDKLSNDGSEVVADSGARYKVIYLGGTSQYMSLAVLEKLAVLVKGGATLIGNNPLGSPTLMDDRERFAQLANELWSGKYAKQVISANSLQQGLDKLAMSADFSYQADNADSVVMFVHRTTANSDIYYFTNRKDRTENGQFRLRKTGIQPQFFNAVSGETHALPYRTEGQYTLIDYDLAAFESGYIVFEQGLNAMLVKGKQVDYQPAKAPASAKKIQVDFGGYWQVDFQQERGAPQQSQQMAVGDWSKNSNEGIRYFSGTATYRRTLEISQADLSSGDKISLNLGEVADIAEVLINGQSAGIAWTPPYVVDATSYLQPGSNDIEIKVTNLWVNRLIGDNQPEIKQTYTFTVIPTYFPDAPLRPSGLIGPVTLTAN
jgi:hypothetical protein